MNKIVCDVCGTSYPETAPQCPICGTAKTDSAKTATGGENTGYAYVKGGRFSHANVRKRNAGKTELPRVVAPAKPKKETAPKKEAKPKKEAATVAPPAEQPTASKSTPKPIRQKPDQEKRERGVNVILAIIALLLVLAILAVFAYIVKGWIEDSQPTEPVGSSTTQPSGTTTSAEIPCTGVRLALSEKQFTSLDEKFYLSVTVSPENTTDTVWYESANELIATVDEKGIVYPVANGQVTIYVHCGEFTAECVITCDVGVEPTDPSQPTEPTEPPMPDVELKLNREEFTLNGYGDSWMLYSGELDPATITWTSSDETIATVTNGKVVAVGNGYCTITAEYMGQIVNCAVRCVNVVKTDYELVASTNPRHATTDFTMKKGSSLTLYMREKETEKRVNAAEVTYSLSKEGIISIDENGKITALAVGTVTVTVTYGENTLTCTVRVSAK